MMNVIKAILRNGVISKTQPLYQYDYGQILQISGVELPSVYEVHFANQQHGESKTMIGGEDGVSIPDEYLLSGQDVWAWVYLHTGADDGETEYSIVIPVIARAKPTDAEPTPVQQGVIEQAIAVLNTAVETTAQDAIAAESARDEAQAYAENAAESAEHAEQQAASAGYLDVAIVDGRLIYTRTDAVNVCFVLDDGHLIMEVV